MSAWLDVAEDMARRLRGINALTGVEVIVDRQKDVRAAIAVAVAKATGCAITILWTGAQNKDTRAEYTYRSGGSYTLRVWAKPIIAGRETPADDVAEAVATALQGWIPCGEESPNKRDRKVEVGDIDMVPDRDFLIYEIPASVRRVPAPSPAT